MSRIAFSLGISWSLSWALYLMPFILRGLSTLAERIYLIMPDPLEHERFHLLLSGDFSPGLGYHALTSSQPEREVTAAFVQLCPLWYLTLGMLLLLSFGFCLLNTKRLLGSGVFSIICTLKLYQAVSWAVRRLTLFPFCQCLQFVTACCLKPLFNKFYLDFSLRQDGKSVPLVHKGLLKYKFLPVL